MEEEPGERARADGDHCNLLSSRANISETEKKPRIAYYEPLARRRQVVLYPLSSFDQPRTAFN
jgi:hypothetical protein